MNRALLLGSLDAEELAEAMAEPAARAELAPPLDKVAILVRESEGQTGTMFLLPFTLEKLRRTLGTTDRRTAPKSGPSACSCRCGWILLTQTGVSYVGSVPHEKYTKFR